jgi:bacterioferritin-associated ferredoxin
VSGLRIDRCVCRRIPFAELLPEAAAAGWDLDALMRATGCGMQCGLCRPYLRRMLRDGTTVFTAVIGPEEDQD